MTDLRVPVSPGELLDKITILEIKSERIEDPDKLGNVRRELDLLTKVWTDSVSEDDEISDLRTLLRRLNEELWGIEDEIREQERRGEFGARFVELARAVYTTNDRRSEAKRRINFHLGSTLIEEKSH
ncbi:MAG: DUF6165 family protein [Gemmatimonadota bacterium]|nr:DUF6165 family protein [Gemmatimonadota bacterium]